MCSSDLIVVFIGLLIANLFHPGAGLNFSVERLNVRKVNPPNAVDTLLNIVSMNPVQAFAEGKFLQIIFFSIFFGFGLSNLGEKGRPLLKIFEIANEIMIKITAAVIYLAPYGVTALIAYTIGKSGASVLLPLIKLIILMYIASVIHVCIVYLPLVKGVGRLKC